VIARRLRDAVTDMSHYAEFDRVIVNEDFERSVGQLLGILRGGAGFESGRADLQPLVADLLA
jgi:guanylate kinase